MTRPWIEPRSSGPLANTRTIMPMSGIFGRFDKMIKNEWKCESTKTQTTDSIQNISFFFIDRNFSTKKIVFSNVEQKWKLIKVYKSEYKMGYRQKTEKERGRNRSKIV